MIEKRKVHFSEVYVNSKEGYDLACHRLRQKAKTKASRVYCTGERIPFSSNFIFSGGMTFCEKNKKIHEEFLKITEKERAIGYLYIIE